MEITTYYNLIVIRPKFIKVPYFIQLITKNKQFSGFFLGEIKKVAAY